MDIGALLERSWVRAVAWALLAVASILLLRMLYGEQAAFGDYRLIWLAGRLWSQGIDPYTPAYVEAMRVRLPMSAPIAWYYPFQWYVVAVPLSWLPLQGSMRLFMLLSLAASLGAGWLMRRAAIDAGVRLPAAVWLLFLAFCMTSTLWDAVLRTRQAVLLAALGFPLLFRGLQRSSKPMITLALVLLQMKPQIGIACWLAVAVAVMGGWLVPALVAGVVTALLSIPALVIGGGIVTVRRFMEVAATYQVDTYNRAMNMSGLPHILYRLTGQNATLTAVTAAGIVGALVLGLWLRRRAPTDPAIRRSGSHCCCRW